MPCHIVVSIPNLFFPPPPRTNQSKGFALLAFCWGLGSIFGPIIGGVLAFPCAEGASSLLPQIFCAYPYLLPFLFSAAYHLGLCVAVCFLCETVRKSPPHKEIDFGAANIENGLGGTNGVYGANGGKIENGKYVMPSDKQNDGVVVEQANKHHYSTLPSEERFLCELAKSVVDKETNGSGNYIVGTEEALKLDVLEGTSPVWPGHVASREVDDMVATNLGRPWDVGGVVVLFGFLMFVQFYAGERFLSRTNRGWGWRWGGWLVLQPFKSRKKMLIDFHVIL